MKQKHGKQTRVEYCRSHDLRFSIDSSGNTGKYHLLHAKISIKEIKKTENSECQGDPENHPAECISG